MALIYAMTAFHLPLPQSPEYARACDAIGRPIRLCKREAHGEVRLLWQIQSRKFGPLGRVDMVSRGPVAATPDDRASWLDRWQHWHDGRPLILNADGMGAVDLRRAGFWPLMTPASLAILPLGTREQMRAAIKQKWRNRLNKAETASLKVTRHALDARHWILGAEIAQSRKRGYRGLPPAFSAAYSKVNPGQALVFEARHNGKPVAAALVLRHGSMATWQIGSSTPAGRQLNAMNLVLWRMMNWLSDQGHDMLDLGLLNRDDAPGLAHFKLGTGAYIHQLGGTWLHQGALAPLARHLPMRLAA
ncbi:acetyltransferase (GNAT) family protein [Pelagimonas varians]|uniref:FemAB family protein n=2 Tax=Pelagimonas varians TaxID=696760 RepID=A0A238JRP2_9RHOB|nr:acetyltransferase (GNAT) family protein [Pelagimonas varians]SMX33319.1 FemAB family protein [Pelagimonas varians]